MRQLSEIYEEFLQFYKKLNDLKQAKALLDWDERVTMPEGAVEERSETQATISSLLHEKVTSEKMKDYIEKLNKESTKSDLNPEQKANVREATREFERAYNVPDELVEEINKTVSLSRSAWVKAKEKEDFEEFLPWLEKLVDLEKQAAEYIGYEDEPYEALLDEHEPGLLTENLENIFDSLRDKLIPLVENIIQTEYEPPNIFEGETFASEKQEKLSKEIAKELGFNYKKGRLDTSAHPFTIGMRQDVRITNRYNEKNLHSIFSAIHETGHALYSQNIPLEISKTPIGRPPSTGYSESQSRLWENQIGRSKAFISYLYPKIQKKFPQISDKTSNKLYKSINRVKRTPIRVNADEVTYNLHILLRFDLELGIFRGEIEPSEIPQIWRNKMDKYLGIEPDSPAEGALQDVHWSTGGFGYFPSYTLGNLYAAQIFETMKKQVKNLEEKIRNGKFTPMKKWLTEKIYKHGRKYRQKKLTKKVTGEELNEDYFLNHLKNRYYPIYDLV